MDADTVSLEERLRSNLEQLNTECPIFERIVYKNKNQHRRSSYFQYLLKVRRDLRLLQSAKLEELLSSCFHVITGKKPKQKLHLLESLKWRKCDCGVPNFMERLLGAARLLSQMVEPMLKAAAEISILLAQSFFMGFSLTVLSLIARLRVLVQQILLDVVSAFNLVSSLSQKKQSVKIAQEGIEVFRDFYPTNKEFITLECKWETDKFILVEKTHKRSLTGQDGDALTPTLAVQYKSIESSLGDDDSEDINNAKEGPTRNQEDTKDLSTSSDPKLENKTQGDGGCELGDNPVNEETKEEQLHLGVPLATSSVAASSQNLPEKSGGKSVAFLPVKRPVPSTPVFVAVKRQATSTVNVLDPDFEESAKDNNSKEDSFFDLLTGGNIRDSLF